MNHDPAILTDIGANLAHDSFDRDRAAVLARARDAGVARIVVTGSSAESSRRARDLSDRYPGLLATAGVHPHHAGDLDAGTIATLRELASHPRVRAIGETGLDFFRDFSPRPDQERAFERQLELAGELGMPLFVHERDAFPRLWEMLRGCRDRLGDIVVHCFTGEARALHAYLDLDCHIGITGWICDERRGTHLVPLMAEVPAGRLMIETDAPYLLPRNLPAPPRERRNEPCYLPWVCRAIAAARGMSEASLARETTAAAERFFGAFD